MKKLRQLNKKAFTLIELLVVVLIIAILAAIALPQYFVTVEKSRASEALTLLSSIASAEERYYLATDAVTNDFGNFDIEITDYAGSSADGATFYSDNFAYSLSTCGTSGSAGFTDCNPTATRMEDTSTVHTTYDYKITRDVELGTVACCYLDASDKGDQVCNALGYTGTVCS